MPGVISVVRLETLELAHNIYPQDIAIQKHLKDIERLLLLGLPENWQGAISIDSK